MQDSSISIGNPLEIILIHRYISTDKSMPSHIRNIAASNNETS